MVDFESIMPFSDLLICSMEFFMVCVPVPVPVDLLIWNLTLPPSQAFCILYALLNGVVLALCAYLLTLRALNLLLSWFRKRSGFMITFVLTSTLSEMILSTFNLFYLLELTFLDSGVLKPSIVGALSELFSRRSVCCCYF